MSGVRPRGKRGAALDHRLESVLWGCRPAPGCLQLRSGGWRRRARRPVRTRSRLTATSPKGALYHHFGSKQGPVRDVYKEAVRRHAELVIATSRDGTGRERLQGLIAASAGFYGSRRRFYRLLLRLHVDARDLSALSRRPRGPCTSAQREYMTEIVAVGGGEGSIRPDLDPQAPGHTVHALLQGFLVQQLEPVAAHPPSVRGAPHHPPIVTASFPPAC